MIYEVKLDGDMYEEAEFRQLIAEYGGEIIDEREENDDQPARLDR